MAPRAIYIGRSSLAAAVVLASCTAPPAAVLVPSMQAQPYVAVDLTERSLYPEASFHGSLGVANGCVVFQQAGPGAPTTPIFPRGTRLVTNSRGNLELIVRSARVSFGKEYMLSGGHVPLTSFGIALASPPPASCPAAYYLVGSIKEE